MTKWILACVFCIPALTASAEEPRSRPDGELPNPLATVYFESGSARIEPDDRRALGAAVDWLEAHPHRLLIIEGHADSRGGTAANLKLSQRRTVAVRNTLVKLGARPLRLVGSSHGEAEATSDHARSRRVEVRGTLRPYEGPVAGARPR